LALEVVDGGVGKDEGDLLFHEGNESIELGNLSAVLLLKMFELLFLDALSSHSDDFLDEGVLGDDEVTVIGSQHLPDQLDLVRADVCERSKDNLLVRSQ